MNFDQAKRYLLAKPEALEDYPFYPDVAVFKVKGKMYATLSRDDGVPHMNLKCDPEQALALRTVFESVRPGYHMNKKHWNTLVLDDSIPSHEVERMIDHSYSLVVRGLKKAERTSLELNYGSDSLYCDPPLNG
ncbi:MmcQ/YjbR family DNA-binding protein [Pseudomaricurvus alkylphenolicus]|jgi:predicted DNA-binding protein (MmcQ/YjbR family)|uniref:MmcQ/YjbR family DNA-binding protein n=1 Tax=Pseudomaricurvus alkylphenolicus TaxID=1306991 RepID=UPI0014231EE3|nr:MmcQ/YjbR family DNA-binding protein [Pseudomaricurvus alkylphenolicus]NIB39637.1 MmcQ/YjbR family DNA-binding protein [Pseudomaricurvus alkylphenolicus]